MLADANIYLDRVTLPRLMTFLSTYQSPKTVNKNANDCDEVSATDHTYHEQNLGSEGMTSDPRFRCGRKPVTGTEIYIR